MEQMIALYSIAFFSLVIGMGAIFTLIEKFPVKLLYYHYHFRKPIIWTAFTVTLIWQILDGKDGIPASSVLPLMIIAVAVVLTYRVHQSSWFRAVYFPKMTTDLATLPLSDNSQMAIIEYEGITKAYSLDYVIHHHIINDKFDDKIVALTYCAMCRSIIPFDVTEIGPLFVASFKNANMIVADRKTGTFFQQVTFNSIIGKLYPYSLKMIMFQILPWQAVKKLNPVPQVAVITKNDLRPFRLPMPGVWKKVMSSELTPGLSTIDKTFPSKIRVIGISDASMNTKIVYLKSEILQQGVVRNDELGITLISMGDTINGYKNTVVSETINLRLKDGQIIEDSISGTHWDITAKYLNGTIKHNLEKIASSDEYWFSWKKFHPESKLVRISNSESTTRM
ncbi:DUF3179 domain-containing protein [bacterium]|nr:DUF3179 domain-containing protein [bacterium]